MRNNIFFLFFTLFVVSLFSQQEQVKNYTIEDGLAGNKIYSITQDYIGYLYLATNKGIVKFDGDDFIKLDTSKANYIHFLDAKLFVASNNKLSVLGIDKKIETKTVHQIFEHKSDIYLATNQGIAILKDNFITPISINTEIDFLIINQISYYNNSFYLATNKGLWKVDSLKNSYQVEKIINDNILTTDTFDDKIYTSTYNNGVKILKDDKLINQIKTITNLTFSRKIKNEFWLASENNGIEVYTLPSFSFKQKINKYNSSIPNTINTFFTDSQNTIWLGSNKGLIKLKDRFSNPLKSSSPKIFFEKVSINNVNLDAKMIKKGIKLASNENNISIEFKTVSLNNSNKIQYRYQLQSKFSNWSNKNTVLLANLDYGNYNFKIQSKLGDKLSNIQSFSFKIDKPLYLKFWFQLSILILFLITALLYVNNYINKIKKINDEKLKQLERDKYLVSLKQKALQLQMNPHFVFNVLNGIKALGNSNKKEALNATISQFSSLLRTLLSNSMVDTTSLKNEIEYLKNYLELEKRMTSQSLNYKFHLNLSNIDAEEIIVPTMLLQPFVENSVKHAFINRDSGEIFIHFAVKKHYLEFTIIDDGIGFKTSKKEKGNHNHKSMALKITRERINNLTTKNNFIIEEIVEDNQIQGTKVFFKIPLKTDF